LPPVGASQAFRLDRDGGFSWLGECNVNIDELLGGRRKPESQFTKARRLIEIELAHGPVPAADMMQMAEEQGISPKTLNRAKEALGVISIKRGVQWYWELPIEAEYTVVEDGGQHSQDSHDGQRNDGCGSDLNMLTAFTIFRESIACNEGGAGL
jgi:hypothetical protein